MSDLTELAETIKTAQDGDTITVQSKAMKRLGKRAAARLRPEITLLFVVEVEGEPKVYFLTVEWCNNGHRGVFCSAGGSAFPKRGGPHTELEMQEILGPFWMILSSESTPISVEELTLYCKFHPLDEYCGDFGIARKAPEEGEECQDQQPTI